MPNKIVVPADPTLIAAVPALTTSASGTARTREHAPVADDYAKSKVAATVHALRLSPFAPTPSRPAAEGANLWAETASPARSPQPAPTTPESTFALVSQCNVDFPSFQEQRVAESLLPLTGDAQGLKTSYFKHPTTGVKLGSHTPPTSPGTPPLDHRSIAKSFADPSMSKEARALLLRAQVLPAKVDDPEKIWGGTRLVREEPPCERYNKNILCLRVTPSGHMGHIANDASINDAIASFYANVCILNNQRAHVQAQAGEPACEAVARRMRAKLRAHFPADRRVAPSLGLQTATL